MSTIITINSSDALETTSRVNINTNFSNLNTDKLETLSTGTTGTDFAVVKTGTAYALNLPDASYTARGLMTTGVQTFKDQKIFKYASANLDNFTPVLVLDNPAGGSNTVIESRVNGTATNRFRMDNSGNMVLTGGAIYFRSLDENTTYGILSGAGLTSVVGSIALGAGQSFSGTYFQDAGSVKGYWDTSASGINWQNFNRVAGNISVQLVAHASQSVDIFQVTNSSGNPYIAVSSAGVLKLGTAGTVAGSITIAGVTSGTTGLVVASAASGTLTLPSATDTLVGKATTDTLTNKFVTPQLQSVADAGGTFTPASITNDMGIATALSQATTIAAPTGSPVQGEKLVIRLKDNGTARALTWNSIYRAGTTIALPTTTTISKTLYCGFIYNSTDTKWDLVAYTDGY